MTPQCQNINDVKDKSYSVIRWHQVYVIHEEGWRHNLYVPIILVMKLWHHPYPWDWWHYTQYNLNDLKYLSTNITLGKYENMNNYPYNCVPKILFLVPFILSTKVINGDTWNNISIVSHGNNYYTWFCVLFKYYPNPEKIWIQNRINL